MIPIPTAVQRRFTEVFLRKGLHKGLHTYYLNTIKSRTIKEAKSPLDF